MIVDRRLRIVELVRPDDMRVCPHQLGLVCWFNSYIQRAASIVLDNYNTTQRRRLDFAIVAKRDIRHRAVGRDRPIKCAVSRKVIYGNL
jgi:hypothetical protein